MMGTLMVIAKDVKIQVEFNPEAVESYRLIGYENRDIADEDFRKDYVDAGEIGAGHSVTALYEVKLNPGPTQNPATVRIRHKQPTGSRATENTYTFSQDHQHSHWKEGSDDFLLALSAASFAEILRDSPTTKHWDLKLVHDIAADLSEETEEGEELLHLIDRAIVLGAN